MGIHTIGVPFFLKGKLLISFVTPIVVSILRVCVGLISGDGGNSPHSCPFTTSGLVHI